MASKRTDDNLKIETSEFHVTPPWNNFTGFVECYLHHGFISPIITNVSLSANKSGNYRCDALKLVLLFHEELRIILYKTVFLILNKGDRWFHDTYSGNFPK